MADLVVNGPGLDDLHAKLCSSSDDMNEATGVISGAQTAALGSPDLAGAGDHFASEWGYGIGQLHKAASNVADQLQEGIRAYTDADAHLSDQMRKAMQQQ